MGRTGLDFNIFSVLNIKPVEDPHDRILAWLCNPAGGHGISDLARAIIKRLWDCDSSETVRAVRRPFGLSNVSWPDVGVEFESTLLLIENKINASALRAGQIELQHELGRLRQGSKPFFHCVLCPDYLTAAIPKPSPNFRTFPYSVLADVLDSRLASCTLDARTVVEQYVAFIRGAFGPGRTTGIRVAQTETIVRRNAIRGTWELEQILEAAREHGGVDLANAHQELNDLLVSMEAVVPRFDSKGRVDPTYWVHSTRDGHPGLLQIYSDGRLFVSWQAFRDSGRMTAVQRMQDAWTRHVKGKRDHDGVLIPGGTGAFTLRTLGAFAPEQIAILLQETVDVTSTVRAT